LRRPRPLHLFVRRHLPSADNLEEMPDGHSQRPLSLAHHIESRPTFTPEAFIKGERHVSEAIHVRLKAANARLGALHATDSGTGKSSEHPIVENLLGFGRAAPRAGRDYVTEHGFTATA